MGVFRKSSKGGFTLIELILAIGLFSLILTVVYGSFSHSIRVKNLVRAEREKIRIAETFLNRLERELESAYVLPQRDPTGRSTGSHPTTIFYGENREGEIPRDHLTFTCRCGEGFLPTLGILGNPTHMEIGYFFEVSVRDPLPYPVRRLDPTLDRDPLSGGFVERLWDRLVGMNFRYLDPLTKRFEDTWDSRTRVQNLLPRAVEVTLFLGDPETVRSDKDAWVVGETILLPDPLR